MVMVSGYRTAMWSHSYRYPSVWWTTSSSEELICINCCWLQVQRWGSAFKANPLPEECLMDERQRVAVCGDMFRTSSAEGAVLSGLAAAKRIRDILMN